MKVYVVKTMDTNCVISIDRIFLSRQDAEKYVDIQKKNYDFVIFLLSEYAVVDESEVCCTV